jgi:hypothetical protein
MEEQWGGSEWREGKLITLKIASFWDQKNIGCSNRGNFT